MFSASNNPAYFLRSVRMVRMRVNRTSPAMMVLSFTRRMSSSPTKHLFAVYAPDYMDSGTLERRLSVRERHLKGINGMLDNGS
ncbi:hypothetical protein BGW80DRAFT_294764 [Lactifluus volemus]|nr:hypothetical protein BGW80DRAFT_294764 [Lactifluus volemus]